MSNMKPGDKVRYRDSKSQHEVIAVFENMAWVTPVDHKSPWTAPLDTLTKVEPFFEAGKTYRQGNQITFEVIRIDENSDGRRVAYGKTKYLPKGRVSHMVRMEFRGWEEITE